MATRRTRKLKCDGKPVYRQSPDGWRILDFVDYNDMPCTLMESSIGMQNLIWFGPVPEGAFNAAHITQKQLKMLLPALQHFVNTGRLPE